MLSGLALITLIVGFFPQPLVKPDWKTAYEKAISVRDCAAASRIIEILGAAGFWREAGEAEFQNKRQNRCDAGALAEHNTGRDSIFHTDSDGYVSRNFLDEDWRSSFFGSRVYFWRGRTKLKMSDVVNAANRDARETLRQCINKVGSIANGLPNYDLLNYALNNPKISSDQISKIAREQQAQCQRQLLAALKVMKVAARTPEDRAAITLYAFPVALLKETAPDQAPLLASIFDDLTLEEYRLARPDTQWSEGEQLAGFACRDDPLAEQMLIYTIQCADEAKAFLRFDQTGAALRAVYYARRAQRLGWRDVQAAEDLAKVHLTEECFSAIVEMEARDAGDNTDPRDFDRPIWPANSGEVCFSEVLTKTEAQ